MKRMITSILRRHEQSDALMLKLVLLVLFSLATVTSACIEPVPLDGKACDTEHLCPDGYFCAGGVCLSAFARCPESSCQIMAAMDCENMRICLDGCWQDCPACERRCADPEYKDCRLPGRDDLWRCRQSEVCVLRVAGRFMRADCHARPAICPDEEDSRCACLTSSAAVSMYPGPCDVEENCVDQSGGQIICETPMPVDAGHNDAGSVRDSGIQPLDASPAADSSSAFDSTSSTDSALAVDAAVGADSSVVMDASTPDAFVPDAATACGPVAPDCFAGLGTGAFGEFCCAADHAPATCVAQTWRCPEQAPYFANSCDGFAAACMDGLAEECADSDACLWTWEQAGVQHCASFGPASPCVDASWDCVSGSADPEDCDCIAEACP